MAKRPSAGHILCLVLGKELWERERGREEDEEPGHVGIEQ